MTPRRILVIGDVMLDVVVKPMTAVAPTSDTPARVRLSRGGSAANMAVALALTGHHVTFLGASGDDVAAQLFSESLLEAGVRAALERVDAPTGVVVAMVGEDAQRAMLTDRGANPMLTMEHVLTQLERPFDHLPRLGLHVPRSNDASRGDGRVGEGRGHATPHLGGRLLGGATDRGDAGRFSRRHKGNINTVRE